MNNLSILNCNSSSDMKLKYNNSLNWRLFSSRICRNTFVLDYLSKKCNNTCSWCGKVFDDRPIVIHHMDYDNQCCDSSGLIEIPKPTPKRPNRTVRVPNCENCYNSNRDMFLKCTNRLTVVHSVCNMIINRVYEKENSK